AMAVAPRADLGAQDLHAGNVWHAYRLAHLTVALGLDREGTDGERDRLPTALGLDARCHEQRECGEGERAKSPQPPVGRHGRPSGARTFIPGDGRSTRISGLRCSTQGVTGAWKASTGRPMPWTGPGPPSCSPCRPVPGCVFLVHRPGARIEQEIVAV